MDGKPVHVLFATAPAGGEATLPKSGVVVVAALPPGGKYRVSVDAKRCVLSVAAASDGADTATAGGFLRATASCAGR